MMDKKLPNIILIILDSARKDMFGCYGNSEGLTPGIDKFSKKGAVLYNHYAAGCGSAQAHVGIFSGQHSARHKMVHNFCDLKDDITTIPGLLKKLGYRTFGDMKFASIPPARHEKLFGFDELRYPLAGGNEHAVLQRAKSRARSLFMKCLPNSWKLRLMAREYDGRASLDYIFRKLKENKAIAPVFAYTTLMHPHTPYYPPGRFLKKVFDGAGIDKTSLKIQLSMNAYVNGDFGEALEAMESVRKCYKANLSYGDYLIGNFIRRLESESLLDDTVVIITSDHGELLGEHGEINHGSTVWEELFSIPCLIYYPDRIAPDTRITNLTSGLDIAPSIFDLLGRREWAHEMAVFDGISVFDEKFDWAGRYLVVDSPPVVCPERLKKYPNMVRKDSVICRAVRTPLYKYIWQSNGDNYLLSAGARECPENNLISDMNDSADKFMDIMKRFYLKMDRNFKIDEYPVPLGKTKSSKMKDPFIVDELVKLGYLSKESTR